MTTVLQGVLEYSGFILSDFFCLFVSFLAHVCFLSVFKM